MKTQNLYLHSPLRVCLLLQDLVQSCLRGGGVVPSPVTLSVCWLFIFKDTEPSPLRDSFSVRQQGLPSVCWLFIFKDTEPSPLQDSSSVRQQGGLPGPPP